MMYSVYIATESDVVFCLHDNGSLMIYFVYIATEV